MYHVSEKICILPDHKKMMQIYYSSQDSPIKFHRNCKDKKVTVSLGAFCTLLPFAFFIFLIFSIEFSLAFGLNRQFLFVPTILYFSGDHDI